MKILQVWFPLALCMSAYGQVAGIAIHTTHTIPLNANFSGFNDEVAFFVAFFDYRLNSVAAQLSPGSVRYPSGSFSDAFNWQTGLMVLTRAAEFQGASISSLIAEGVPWVDGKGRASSVQCYVAEHSVPVLFAAAQSSFGGLDQVNISLPQSVAGAGDVRVYLVADGVVSNGVGLNIR